MAAVTRGIACPAGQWTPLAIGRKKVTVVVRGIGTAKLLAQACLDDEGNPLPGPSGPPGVNYLTLSAAKGWALGFDDYSTGVYVWPSLGPIVVEVLSEGVAPVGPDTIGLLDFSIPSNSGFVGQVI